MRHVKSISPAYLSIPALRTHTHSRRTHSLCQDSSSAKKIIEKLKTTIEFNNIAEDSKVSKVSVVGSGMRTKPGVAKTMFKTLADNNINIQVISTSEIKISVLISSDYTELAVRTLHDAFGLGK